MLVLHSAWKRKDGNADIIRASIAAALNSQANVRQTIEATFYLFGLVLFLGLQTVGYWVGDGKISADILVLRNFILHAAFAANVFFIFLVLHFLHWGSLAILNSLSGRVNEHPK